MTESTQWHRVECRRVDALMGPWREHNASGRFDNPEAAFALKRQCEKESPLGFHWRVVKHTDTVEVCEPPAAWEEGRRYRSLVSSDEFEAVKVFEDASAVLVYGQSSLSAYAILLNARRRKNYEEI